MATTVTINAVDPTATAMVTFQSSTSTTKETTFYNPTSGAAQLLAGPQTFSSQSTGTSWQPCNRAHSRRIVSP